MLKVLDLNGDSQEVEVIRYFKMNGSDYLLYALNEIDEQDYLKLYGAKVGEGVANNIDDAEWDLIKDEIKKIIKGNKEGNLQIDDLNPVEISGITINDYRAFKLSMELVNLLKANKKEFMMDPVAEPAVEESVPETEAEMPMPEVEESRFGVSEESQFDLPKEEENQFELPKEEETQVELPKEEETQVELPKEEEPVAENNPFDFPGEEAKFDFKTQEVQEEPPAAGFDLGAEIAAVPEMPTPEAVASLEPTPIRTFETDETVNYEEMYKEAQDVNNFLKNENEELKAKLGKITQLLHE